MASILISDLYGVVVTEDEISQAFMDVLDDLEDITLDTPDAPEVRRLCFIIAGKRAIFVQFLYNLPGFY